jgi:hypothetical protein
MWCSVCLRAGFGGPTAVRAVSGRDDGDLMAVQLGQVVSCHQQPPLSAHGGSASSEESGDMAVVLGVSEHWLDLPSGFSDHCPIQLADTDTVPLFNPALTTFQHTR